MRAQAHLPFIFNYWGTLFRLFRGQSELKKNLDLPLDAAVTRSFVAISWTVFWVMTTLLLINFSLLTKMYVSLHLWSVILLLLTFIFSTVLAYGFFRLYVLISHVIAINIFKSRGQRLRWLNQLTTILSISFPVCISFVLLSGQNKIHWLGEILLFVFGAYAILLGAWTCQLVFHKNWSSFHFFIEINIVTLFVLGTCFIAVLAALAILAFFVVLIARIF